MVQAPAVRYRRRRAPPEGSHFDIVLLGPAARRLFSVYRSQAERAPGDQLASTPGGPRRLTAELVPPGDIYIAVATPRRLCSTIDRR
jgi:hypothetical protein